MPGYSTLNSSAGRGGPPRDTRALLLGVGAGVIVLACVLFLTLSWNKISGNERVTIAPTPEYLESVKPFTDELSRLSAMSIPELQKELASRKARAAAANGRDKGELEEAVDRCEDVYHAALAKAQATPAADDKH